MSEVGAAMEVAAGVSSTSILESPRRGVMNLEATHGSHDVGIAPRKGKESLQRISLSLFGRSGDCDDSADSQHVLGMDSVGDASQPMLWVNSVGRHPPSNSSQGHSIGDGGYFESPMECARRQLKA